MSDIDHRLHSEWPGSAFPGLWVDRADAIDELHRRVADGRIAEGDEEHVVQFLRDGYTILPGAVPTEVCDAIRRELASAWEHGSDRLLMQEPGSPVTVPVQPGLAPDMMRVVDMHAVLPVSRDALFAPRIVRFLSTLFDRDPLLFQSLSFERGSQQGLHQDTAYVVVSSPRHLAATWIALEDIEPGSGELAYVPGSHRLPERLFSGEFKHWNPERDGVEQHERWSRHLVEESARQGLVTRTFRPRTGDVLVWHADLVHGGSTVLDPRASRRSLVGHYCPTDVSPHYFGYAPHRRTVLDHPGGRYSSFHVDLSAAT